MDDERDGRRVRSARALRATGAATALTIGLLGCSVPGSPAGPATAEGPTTAGSSEAADFVSVVDGDTVETSAGTIRIIGIDTPERGECGHDEASAAIEGLLSAGDPVTLDLPAGQNDRDRHGRLLRYVVTEDGVDIGLMQLETGNALARYDSRDGYPAHPFEDGYRAAQRASSGPDGTVVTTACQDGTSPEVVPPAGDRWWERYPSCARLKKNEAGHPTGPFRQGDPAEAEIYAWFAYGTGNGGDGDGDGLACE
ncbi:hypothetical protein J4H92_03620 [Leucobacter weissii]|uniref:TNase-like domain-containing protein n=1 Tax=Leucobacter weissii TaxID=1983706 RepID=A0A939MLK5_9MICO|nr:thermonuclease family protein [Leucobacter weissii]MBO1901037.1 hypothetical protein [Leucobacter weissii]